MLERGERTPVSPWVPFRPPIERDIQPNIRRTLVDEFRKPGDDPQDYQTEFSLAESLYRQNFSLKTYSDAVQTYFDLCLTLNNTHLQSGGNFQTPRSAIEMNNLWMHVGRRMAMDHAKSIPDEFELQLHSLHERLGNKNDFNGWFQPKVFHISNEIGKWRETYKWLDVIKDRLKHVTEGENVEELKADADAIFAKTFSDQKYGVKPCYFQSSIFSASPDDAITVYDNTFGIDVTDEIFERQVNFEAAVSLGKKPTGQIRGKKIDASKQLVGAELKNKYVKFENIFNVFLINKDGQILLNSTGLLTAEKAFKKVGMEKEYHYFRLFIGLRLHDLVTKTEVSDELPSIDEFEMDVVETALNQTNKSSSERKLDYRRLLLPRLGSTPGLEMSVGQKRFVDRHKVVWFIRRLPKGYYSSNQAKEYAKSCGVDLSDGETIVKEHFRGKNESKTEIPHRASLRPNVN